jgi:hypothetical protein
MTRPNPTTRLSFVVPLHQLFVALVTAILVLVLASVSNGQTSDATDGSTPAGLTPGSPAGVHTG